MILIGALLLPVATSSAQPDKKGDVKDTVGVMTGPVIRARLQALGYSNIRIARTNTLRYRIDATKEGKPAVLELHPQTGEVREIATSGSPAKTWMMPIELPVQPTGKKKPQ